MFMDEEKSYGCAQCGDDVRTELVREFIQVAEVQGFLTTSNDRRILMMPEFVFFFTEVLSALKDAQNVAAVIVYEPTTDANGGVLSYPPLKTKKLSTDFPEPNSKYNYYPTSSPTASPEVGATSPEPIARNSQGKSNKFFLYPFNIFRVTASVADDIRSRIESFPSKDGVLSGQEDSTNPSATSPRYKMQSVGQMYACPSPVQTPAADVDGEESNSEALGLLMNSETCLKANTCLPIGGQSIWSALEHVDPSNQSEILAITAPMDSLAFFPDLALGASAEIASLAVLMAVAEAVSLYRREKAKDVPFKRQPVYFVWNAQSWGYSGSSRFLKDVKEFDCTDENDASSFKKGCKKPFMDSLKFLDFRDANFTVLNIGQLTSPVLDEANSTFEFFIQGGKEERDGASEVEEALQLAFGMNLTNGTREVTPIDASQSFRRYRPDSDVITVSNYKRDYTNNLYHSMYDNVTLITDRQPLYAAADAIANAVISLTFDDKASQVKVDPNVIDGVLTCMTGRSQWADCGLAKEYIGSLFDEISTSVTPGNYPGSFFPSTRLADTNPSGAAKLAFIRSFLAYHNRYDVEEEEVKCSTRVEDQEDCTEFIKKINDKLQVTTHSQLRTAFCARDSCVASDTYTHNAFGASLRSANDDQTVFEYNNDTSATQSSIPLEAGWTESVWDPDIGLCGYVEDTALFGGVILGLGVAVLLASMGLTFWFERAMFNSKPRESGGIPISAASPMWIPEAQPSV